MANGSSNNQNLVTATFNDRKSADRAYNAVKDRRGYGENDVTVLMSEEAKDQHFGDDVEIKKGNKASEGAGVGAAVGGVSGGVAGALAAVGSAIAVPGIGLVIGGPLAAVLAGAGAGGGAGTLLGALVGAGIPEERAKRYKKDLEEGRIVLGVKPHSSEDAEYFESTWRDIGGEHIHTGSATSGKTREERMPEDRGSKERGAERSPTQRTRASEAPADDYATHEDSFRTHHRNTYGDDSDYAEHEAAYRFGHESAQSSEFRGRSYEDAEDDLRRRYQERHPNSSWDKVKHAVRHAFTNDPARTTSRSTPPESRL